MKIKDIVNNLDYEDLLKLRKDIDLNLIFLKKIVNKKIKEIENKSKKICAVCNKPIDLTKDYEYTLIFGPPGFKRRASFCAIDCLEEFISELRNIEEKKIKIKINSKK